MKTTLCRGSGFIGRPSDITAESSAQGQACVCCNVREEGGVCVCGLGSCAGPWHCEASKQTHTHTHTHTHPVVLHEVELAVEVVQRLERLVGRPIGTDAE